MSGQIQPAGNPVCMLMRGSARNHPRVLKEAVTLADAGCRVTIVTTAIAGESRRVERLERGVIVVRIDSGLGLLSLARGRRRKRTDGATGPAGAASRLPRWRLSLMLISRTILAVRLAAAGMRAGPRLVHAHDFSTLPAGWLLSRLSRIPLVYDAHEVNVSREGYYRQLVPIIARLEGCLIRHCSTVITTTHIRAKHFRRIYRLTSTPVVLQNRPRLVVSGTTGSDVRTRLGIPQARLLTIYQGGLQEGRGLHNYIRAVARTPEIHALLVGAGHQEGSLRALVRELLLQDRVHFHPRVALEEMPGITAASDVGVQVLRNTCFNHWSTDSNKLFEYALAGLAVVASDFPEIRRIVRAHDFGLLVDPESVDAIAAALERLRDDRALLSRLRRSARSAAEALSWHSQEPTLLGVYRNLGLIGDAGRPDRCGAPRVP